MWSIFLGLGVLGLFLSTAQAQTVYLKPAEVLKQIFRDSGEVVSDKKTLTSDQKACAEKLLGSKIQKMEWNFQVARTGRRVDGYAVIDNEIGKTEPITFLTAITPEGRVKEVEILVYREPYGSEIHDKKYLKQYHGKRIEDPVRVGSDIANMSGATMSSRSVALGVKRALAVWSCVYGK